MELILAAEALIRAMTARKEYDPSNPANFDPAILYALIELDRAATLSRKRLKKI